MDKFPITSELIISGILIGILFLFFRPMGILMPKTTEAGLVVGLVTSFFLFTSLIWKEQPKDERENLHSLMAGRFSYLFGTGALVAGIVIQSFTHDIDPWLIIALIGMIAVKIAVRILSQFRN